MNSSNLGPVSVDSSNPDLSDFPVPNTPDDPANSIATAAIVSAVIGGITTIAVIIAIIYCLKKTGDSMHKQAQLLELAVGGNKKSSNRRFDDDDLQIGATMERFLGDMAREKTN